MKFNISRTLLVLVLAVVLNFEPGNLSSINIQKHLMKRIVWSKSRISYALQGRVESRNQTRFDVVRRVIDESFQEWEFKSCFEFRDITPSSHADIKVVFTNDHSQTNDHKSCDRRFRGSAGHAFFRNHKKFPAQIHINNEISWMESSKMPGNISLKTVLLHEIGHVLGLMHSADLNSVMYEFIYTNKVKKVTVTDKATLNRLYKYFC